MAKGREETTGQERDWLSIPEAAEYLGISQPTLFRWMKQGTVTYYKVGGSTRFSRTSLDMVVQKRTGQREARLVVERCACCGHSELIEGKIQGTGGLYFRPAKTKFWVLSEGMVPTHCHVCKACGYVQLHADVEKLRRLVDSAATKARKDGPEKETPL